MELIKGKKYKKSDFGISGIVQQWSEITVKGELFTFFSFESGFDNVIEKDGFVYEGRGEYALIPKGVKSDIHRQVFFKETKGSYYTYLGRGKYDCGYDEKRNKIFWEEEWNRNDTICRLLL